MRLLVPTTSYPTDTNPASGIFIRRLIAHLPDTVRITVITPAARCPLKLEAKSNIKILPVRYAPRRYQRMAHEPGGLPAVKAANPWRMAGLAALGAALSIAVIRRTARADLIHAHWSLCGAIAGFAGAVLNRPAVTTIWGSDFNLARRSAAVGWMLRACIRTNRRVVTVNPMMAAQLKRAFPMWAHKIVTISNGVGDRFLAINPKRSDDFNVAVIGNLTQAKGVHHVLRAFQKTAARLDRARLMVVGDGPERDALRQLARALGISPRTTFTGQVDPWQIPRILSGCSVLVLASSGEGRPNVVLEAMAAGVPVVASDIEGVRGLIDHDRTGLLFRMGDWQQLADCLQRLIDQPSMAARLAGHARQFIVSEGLTWSGCADRYMQLYRAVLEEWRRS